MSLESVRYSLFVLLLCHLGPVQADLTGVALEISDFESDWKFDDGTRVAKSNSIGLQVEERTESGLTLGGSLAYLSMRVPADATSSAVKFEGENLQIYMRQDFPLGEFISLEGLLSYGYNTGRENVEGERVEVDWSQISAELGVSFHFEKMRVTPFASYTDIDGDISGLGGNGAFELEDPFSHGVRFDIFVESTAFIAIRLQNGSQTGGYISFVRRY